MMGLPDAKWQEKEEEVQEQQNHEQCVTISCS